MAQHEMPGAVEPNRLRAESPANQVSDLTSDADSTPERIATSEAWRIHNDRTSAQHLPIILAIPAGLVGLMSALAAKGRIERLRDILLGLFALAAGALGSEVPDRAWPGVGYVAGIFLWPLCGVLVSSFVEWVGARFVLSGPVGVPAYRRAWSRLILLTAMAVALVTPPVLFAFGGERFYVWGAAGLFAASIVLVVATIFVSAAIGRVRPTRSDHRATPG